MTKRFVVLSIVFSVCLVASNLFEIKIFQAGPLELTGGFLIFPISYVINDLLTEIYGFKKARLVIWTAMLVNVSFVLIAQLVRILPPVGYWDGQEHFSYIFSANFRITLASMLAFVCGSTMNALVMDRMKSRHGRRFFGWRAILSSLVGESVDSVIFFPIAFFGVGMRNILVLMVTQVVLKTLYEVIVLPVTYRYVLHLREKGEEAAAQ